VLRDLVSLQLDKGGVGVSPAPLLLFLFILAL